MALRVGEQICISIHALREEGDPSALSAIAKVSNFYPRPPRGGRREILGRFCILYDISIHALREEGDRERLLRASQALAISIHALREEGDPGLNVDPGNASEFLSTPSARRATWRCTSC